MSDFARFISQQVVKTMEGWNLWEFVWETVEGERKVGRTWRALDVEELFWDGGDIVGMALCPHKNTAGFGGLPGCSDDMWLQGDLELLRRCDAVNRLTSIENGDANRLASVDGAVLASNGDAGDDGHE